MRSLHRDARSAQGGSCNTAETAARCPPAGGPGGPRTNRSVDAIQICFFARCGASCGLFSGAGGVCGIACMWRCSETRGRERERAALYEATGTGTI